MKATPRLVRLQLATAIAATVSALLVGCGSGIAKAPSTTDPTASAAPSPTPASASEELAAVPSGSLFFAAGGANNLYIVDSDGSGLKQLTNSLENDGIGGFSPDGSLIACTSQAREDGADGVYVMAPDGSNVRLVASNAIAGEYADDPRTAEFVSWSSRGKILYLEAGHQVWGDYWTSDADGSNSVRISANNGCPNPVEWSPDGQNLALCQCTWTREGSSPCSLSIVDPQGGLIRTLIKDDPAMLGSPSWSPDEKEILFIDCSETGSVSNCVASSSLSVVDADGSNLRNLYQIPADAGGAAARWSPDGSEILLTTSQGTLAVSPIDGSSRAIEKGSTSPDGSKIAMRTDEGIDVISVADGGSQTVIGATNVTGLLWSPNSDKIAYVSQTDNGSELYVVESDGSHSQTVDHAAEIGGFTWSPDGQRILFESVRDQSGVWWTSPDGAERGRLQQVSEEIPKYTCCPVPSDLAAEGLVGSCKKGVETSEMLSSSCLSPDGKSEAIVAMPAPESTTLTIKDVASGTTREIAIPGVETYESPIWSNDGTKIAVHGENAGTNHGLHEENGQYDGVYVMDVATGEAHLVATGALIGSGEDPTIAWSPDDSYIYYVKGDFCFVGCGPGLLYRVHPDGTGDQKVVDMVAGQIYGFKP